MLKEDTQDHINPTDEITIDIVKKRAVKGVAILTGRTFVLYGISMIAWVFLTIFLDPGENGIFLIVSAFVNFLAYFSDIGLAAALVQKKDKVTDKDLYTTFTIQQLLVLFLLSILFLLSGKITEIYHLNQAGRLLLFSLGFSLLLSSLKTIPSILMERELDFQKFVIPQIIENLVYYLTAVFFAWKGYGISSFAYAVLARGFCGLLAVYLLRPWKPVIQVDKISLKKLLKFGVPYQINTFLATIKDDGMTAFLGGLLGASGVGYLGWAQKWSQTPLRLFMDNVLKVTFPAYARMQNDKVSLASSLTKSIFFVCFLVFPSVVGFLILAPVMITLVPRYDQWKPALVPLTLVSINTLFAAATTQLTNMLNAIGKIKTTFKLMVMWTALTWLVIPLFSLKFGVNGAAAGYAIVGSSSLVALIIAHRIVSFSFIDSVFRPLAGAFVMGAVLLMLRSFLVYNLYSVFLLIILGITIYFSVMYKIIGPSIVTDVKRSFKLMSGKQNEE